MTRKRNGDEQVKTGWAGDSKGGLVRWGMETETRIEKKEKEKAKPCCEEELASRREEYLAARREEKLVSKRKREKKRKSVKVKSDDGVGSSKDVETEGHIYGLVSTESFLGTCNFYNSNWLFRLFDDLVVMKVTVDQEIDLFFNIFWLVLAGFLVPLLIMLLFPDLFKFKIICFLAHLACFFAHLGLHLLD